MKMIKLTNLKVFRLLALMLCLASTVPQLQAEVTIYVTSGMAPKLFLFNVNGTAPSDYTSWSGKQLSEQVTTSDGVTWYYVTLPDVSSTSIIFNSNSSPQTTDITGVSGTKYYFYNNLTGDYADLGNSSHQFALFINTGNWSSVYGYTFGNETAGGWPGKRAVKVGNNGTNDIYGWGVATTSSSTNIIFNNNSGSQTSDLSYSKGSIYNRNGDTGNVYVTPSVTPPTPHYYITGDNALGLGGFTCVPTLELTDNDEDGIYTYTATASANGTYSFVFANGQGANTNDWTNFNNNYRIGPTSGNVTVPLNGAFQSTQLAGGDNGAYQVTVAAGIVTFSFKPGDMTFKVEGTELVIIPDYYVVGDIFPNGWNTGASTQMTDNNGTYTWTSGQIHLDAGTNYEYKVLDSNGTYHPSGANATFHVDAPGTYTVTVTYDSTTGTVNAVATVEQLDPTYNYTFYVLPDDGNTVPTLYLWGTNNNSYHPNGDWPGTAMGTTEQLDDGNNWYKYTGALYANLMNAIVNNGGNGHQTADITSLAPDTYYIYWNVNSDTYTITTTAPVPAPTYDYTIYVRYKGGDTPYMYMWDGANNELLYSFPGTALTDFTSEQINGYTYYKCVVTGSNYPSLNVILNEGTSGQTQNLAVAPGTSYFTYGGGNTVSGPNAAADPATVYYAESDFGGWTTDGTQMTANSDGSYSKTFTGVTLSKGTQYGYKVYGNDGTSEGVWIGDSNGGNATLTPDMSGTYTVTITLNNDGTLSHTLTMTAAGTVYITGDGVLGGFSCDQGIAMTYTSNGIYTYATTLSDKATTQFVFADGQDADWNTFNSTYRIGPDNGNETYTVNSGYTSTQKAGGDNGSYSVEAGAGALTFYFDAINMQYKVEGTVPPVIYYVVGNDANLFGASWSQNAAGRMTDNGNGTYTWTVSGVHLNESGTYSFKVNGDDNSWYPADNITLDVTQNGTYDLTVNFDGTDVTYTLTPVTLDPVYTYNIFVRYEGNESLSNVYTHAWDGNGDKTNWPGLAFADMGTTVINGYTYYTVTYTSYDPTLGLLFNENGNTQTADLSAVPGDNYFTYGGGSSVTGPTTTPDGPLSYYITGSDGLGLGWSYDQPTAMTFDATTNIYSYTYNVTEDGTYNFVFANGPGNSWDNFNSTHRIGPQSGDQAIALDNNWVSTQFAGGDNGAYQINVAAGQVTIYFDPVNMQFKVEATPPTYEYTFYVNASDGTTLPYIYIWDNAQNVYTNSYPGTAMTTTEVLPDGQTWHKWSGTILVDVLNVIVSGGGDNADDTKTKNITNFEPGTYYIVWYPDRPDDEEYNPFELYNEEPAAQGEHQLFIHGGYYHNGETFTYDSNTGSELKYDANTGNYYINNVTLSSNSTFCFSTLLGSDWQSAGTRYGNGGTVYTDNPNGTNYLEVDPSMINTNMPLNEWSEIYGEYKMFTAGVFNILVNPSQHWVKLIKTDHKNLTPMNVYLEQTSNVIIDNVQEPGTTYNTGMFSGYWPLSAYNELQGGWDPNNDNQHYPVTYIGDTTTVDGKTWWHWQVSASIAEVFFTRTGDHSPYQSETIRRRAGVLWYTWDEIDGQTVMTDHTREYFEAAANALPSNAVVMEGHYYVYFINTLDWDQVYCYAWDDAEGQYTDGYNRVMEKWPGHICELIGIDPVTGYEVWRYDLGTISSIDHEPDGILFNDGDTNAQSDSKEQTGNFEYINGGVYDYLGLFDGNYTLNNLIRTAAEEVRYTVSNDLVGVYYDADAVSTIHYYNKYGELVSEDIQGALYAKDLNQYGEKSLKPDSTYTDYVYDICYSSHTAGRSQIMNKKTTYDQSNWVKLVISPNYDGRNPVPVASNERPDLSQYVNSIIPAGTLDVFMTDTINPTAHVLAITKGEPMTYEPNVYVSAHFNDTIVFSYAHNEWMPTGGEYTGTYRTKPHVEWITDPETGEVIRGEVTRERVEEDPYMMFYVAPKPQEIAYLTWMVYDNLNIEENGVKPYGDYVSGEYMPYTSAAYFLPQDPGRFFSPRNWNRSQVIPGEMYESLQYLSEDQLENALGGYGTEFGPYSNGYMQYGGVKVNWSLFDEEKVGMPWWQIFQPGQAYKIKAIIRYARGNGENYQPNECYGPGNGDTEASNHNLNAPRRIDGNGQGDYANMYFTDDYNGLEDSKFIIFPIEASPSGSNGDSMGNVTTVKEVASARTVTAVRYYNLMGVESDKPFDGLNIIVTFYSDGSRTSKKVLR